MKVNIGCGFRLLAGYVNMDILPLEALQSRGMACLGEAVTLPADAQFWQHDVRDGLPFSADTVKEIILRETLEHFTYAQGLALLHECRRVLVPGGHIEGLVPDIAAWMRVFMSERPWPETLRAMPGPFAHPRENTMAHLLYGDPATPGYEHKAQYTHAMLQQACAQAGLAVVTWNVPEHEGVGLFFQGSKACPV